MVVSWVDELGTYPSVSGISRLQAGEDVKISICLMEKNWIRGYLTLSKEYSETLAAKGFRQE
ncbi:hypothetical protein [Brasilonema sp. UFV-L1]|uniref:hypothetical protein n=1 Tax=Brasilonema sp. UFV-L1 TaxID=2234130 RepID=UPI00145CFD7C|nr:hypothetical protein [Brasilonema sp. UFV-L1]